MMVTALCYLRWREELAARGLKADKSMITIWRFAVLRLAPLGAGTALLTARAVNNVLQPRLNALASLAKRFDCPDDQKFGVVEKVKAKLQKDRATFSDIDGVRVSTRDGWWLLRASNTQPVLVARCEAADDAGLERLMAESLEDLLTYLETLR